MPYQGRARNLVSTTRLLILAVCLLPGCLSKPISIANELGHARGSYDGRPCMNNVRNGHPCLTTKTLDNESRKRNSPCPGTNCDSEDTGSPFSPSSTNPAGARSGSNPLRYPVLLLRYLISAARADMTRTKRYTGGQDEEAKIEDIAYGWRHGPQSTVPTVDSTSAVEGPTFITRAAPSSSPKLDLKRHERKEALDWLDCNVRDVNIVERYLSDKCPVETVKVGRSVALEDPNSRISPASQGGDDSPTLGLDLNLTDAACGDNETSEEGKNAWQGLGLGSALVGLWEKGQKAYKAIYAWLGLDDGLWKARIL